ncbi:MAG: hypothetical protein AB1345_04345 [Chloroflexota bacterium]
MKRKYDYWATTLVIGILLLTACGGTTGVPVVSTETEVAYPEPGEGISPGGGERGYPSPGTSAEGGGPYPGPSAPSVVLIGEIPVPVNELTPAPGDEKLLRGNVFIDTADIILMESFPVQVRLDLTGSLPTPCHILRMVVFEPDENNRIRVEMYSLVDAEKICIQVVAPFEAHVSLGSFTEGDFTVWVNEEQVGEFNLP